MTSENDDVLDELPDQIDAAGFYARYEAGDSLGK